MKRELARFFNWIVPGTSRKKDAVEDKTRRVEVNGFAVNVTFKSIKNIYLKVVPPDGTVKVSAPKRMSLKAVREFVDARADWITRHQRRIAACNHQPPPRYPHRELHQVWGKSYILYVVEDDHEPFVDLTHTRMILHVRPGTNGDKRREIVETWRRDQVKKAALPLIANWEPTLGVTVSRLSVRRMKTRWGSCSHARRSIRLNTSLSAKAPKLLEYVVVHEMAHLLEPSHDGRFKTLMDQYLPGWRGLRKDLNQREENQLNSEKG